MASSFKRYLQEIARFPLLTVDQEIQYGRRIATMQGLKQLDRPLTNAEQRLVRSGLRARERFMQCNLQLVVHVAKKYENRKCKSLEIMDLVQEGNIGLARAVELFDYSRGYKFSTYAYWWIKQGIQRAISQNDAMIRLPAGLNDLLYKISRTTFELGQQLGRPPSMKEIADNMSIGLNVIHDAMRRSLAVCSLDAISSNNDTASILDMIPDLRPLEVAEISQQAMEMLELIDKCLDKNVAHVIKCRRLQTPMPWIELQAATGLPASQLRHLERAGILRLRMILNQGKELHDTPLGAFYHESS